MRYLDTCDRCLTEDSKAIPPAVVVPTGPGAVLATYHCPNCRTTWVCGWRVQEDEAAA
ncbi:hypothetical protein TPA0906_66060 [Streptomyces olivaceus]|uniref:hypothetical protein n=1 Tax=Streptomyces olivaceus TaxID=47716 RepID=UPI0022EE591A|nr:hypothetical protein [Streptomyces olivaceus]GHJ04741.1 hypothetical protein TPA0906_66060 [Streptomyces olivaceus]